MKTWGVMVALALIAAWAQALLPPVSLVGHAKWPLLWIVVLYYGLRRDVWRTSVAALVAGLLQDGMGYTPLGFSFLVFLLFGLCAAGIRAVLLTDGPMTAVASGMILTLAMVLTSGVVLRAGGHVSLASSVLFAKGLGSALLAGIAIVPVFSCATQADSLAGNARMKDDLHD